MLLSYCDEDVPEWLNGTVSKTVGSRCAVPRVRIPPSSLIVITVTVTL